MISQLIKNEKKKLITWDIFDIYGRAPKKKRLTRIIKPDLREEFQKKKLFEEYNEEYKYLSSFMKNLKSSELLNEKNNNFNEQKDLNNAKYSSDINIKKNTECNECESNNSKNMIKKAKNFYLTINEVKINDSKIGYIFKFESYNENNTKNYSIFNSGISHKNISKIKVEHSDIEISGMSEMSFVPKISKNNLLKQIIFDRTSENPNGIDLGLNLTFIPKLSKENEFYFDPERMSYRKININDKNKDYKIFDNILKEEAEQKILSLKVNEENEKEESEESSSSYIDSSNEEENENENENNKSFSLNSMDKNEERKSIIEKENIQENIPISKNSNNNLYNNPILRNSIRSPIGQKTKKVLEISLQKNKDISLNDFYHINTDHITLFLYNFNTGFVEAIKDSKVKISQMTSQMEIHKEAIKKSNSAYISNPKLENKEKKKNLNNTLKKSDISDNGTTFLNEKKIKLLEIEKTLNSKERQSSIMDLYLFSFVVFILIIGSCFSSILYNNLMKKNIFNYYYLVEKSITLYKNILYEIFFVREMVSISNPNYINIYQKDKNLYFLNFSSTCNEYYLKTSSILTSLSIYFNSLNEKEKNKFMNKKGNVIIIDKINSTNTTFYYKEYEILIYSALHEINAALYHISQMRIKDVTENEENIFYFIRNSLNFTLIMINEQIELIIDEFNEGILFEKYYLLICALIMIIVYIISYFIFIHFYKKVENKKESYLLIFKNLGKEYIFESLKKCEIFSQQIHLKDDLKNNQIENNTEEFSKDEENLENNDIISINNIKKIKEIKSTNTSSRKSEKLIYHSKEKILGLIIFFVLLLIQLYTYLYYLTRLNLYKECGQYEYFNNQYNSLFLYPFIALREYLHQSNNTIMGKELTEYIGNYLNSYYMNLNEISENRNKYNIYLPDSYKKYLDDLYNNKMCSLLDEFILEYKNSTNDSCDSFFYNFSYYGFDSITMSFIEDIRDMNYLADEIYKNENDYINKKNQLIEIMQNDKYKMSIIIYRFVIMKVIEQSLNKLFDAMRLNFDETMKISLIINIIFMAFVTIGFFIFWIPFISEENETIFKIKNMLCIIPKDVLLDLPNIDERLGIDGEN